MTKCPWIAGLCAFEGARILPANRKGIREAIGVTSGGGSWLLQQSDSVCSMHTGFPVFGPLRTCGAKRNWPSAENTSSPALKKFRGCWTGDVMKSRGFYGLQVVAGSLFIAAGAAKLVGMDLMVQQFDMVGIGQWFRLFAGSIEIVGGLLLFIPRAAFVGALLVSCVI